MIAKLEKTQSNAQQHMEQTQNPTIRATINNNRTAALEWTAAYASGGGGGLNACYWYQMFSLDAIVDLKASLTSA